MAASNVNPAGSILEIAETGKSLMSSLTKFMTYRKVSDRRLENLYSTLAITTTALKNLGCTINTYAMDFHVKDEITKQACDFCKANFDKMNVLVNEGNGKGIWKNDGSLGGKAVTAEIDPWYLFMMALGSPEEANTYFRGLDITRDSIVVLSDIVHYTILKDLDQKKHLNNEQAHDFQELKALLPHLAQSYEKLEKRIKADAKASAKAAAAKAEMEIWEEKRKQEDAEEAAKAKTENAEPKLPGLTRQTSIASSDATIVDRGRNTRREERVFVKDIDCNSIYSTSTRSSRDSGSFIDKDEIYEEWLFRWNVPIKNLQRSWSFLGLKVKAFFEDSGYWGTDPMLASQEEMKEQHEIAAAGLTDAEHRIAMEKAVRAIPKKGGESIDGLLERRTMSSSSEVAKRQWSVVAVRPKQKFQYSNSKKNWGKDVRYTDWLITIKGETIDTVKRGRAFATEDPWRKPYRIRSRSPRRSRYRRDRYRSVSPYRAFPPPPPPPPAGTPFGRRLPPPPSSKEAVPDEGFRVCTVVVGQIESQENAEKKMEEIWAEMTSKATPEPSS